jgi:hypothetical protein
LIDILKNEYFAMFILGKKHQNVLLVIFGFLVGIKTSKIAFVIYKFFIQCNEVKRYVIKNSFKPC